MSHLRGMSWYVPSGRVLRIVRGSILVSSSMRAMSIGPPRLSGDSMRMGAPIAIWRALAPTIRARSKRVIFLGPIATSFFVVVLKRSYMPGGMPMPPIPPIPPPPGGIGGVFIFPEAITSSIFRINVAASVQDLIICFLTAMGS